MEDRVAFFERQVRAVAIEGTDRLHKTITKCWPKIQRLFATLVAIAKVEKASTMIKDTARIASGFELLPESSTNPTEYQPCIPLSGAACAVA